VSQRKKNVLKQLTKTVCQPAKIRSSAVEPFFTSITNSEKMFVGKKYNTEASCIVDKKVLKHPKEVYDSGKLLMDIFENLLKVIWRRLEIFDQEFFKG
jgi:hypothetical protein